MSKGSQEVPAELSTLALAIAPVADDIQSDHQESPMEVRHISSPPPAAPSVYVRAEHMGTCVGARNAHAHADRSGTRLENLDVPPSLVRLALGSGRTGLVAMDAPTDGGTA